MSQAHGAYYVPHGSHWPIVGSVSLFVTMLGAAALLNGLSIAPFIFWTGIAAVLWAAIERDDGNDTARSGMDFYFNVPPMMPVGAPDPRDIDRRSAAWRLRRAVTRGAD